MLLPPRDRQKPLDLRDERFGIDHGVVVVAGQLDEACAGDALGHQPPVPDVDRAVASPVDDERRHANRGQHVPHVDLDVHATERSCGARARAVARPPRPAARFLG